MKKIKLKSTLILSVTLLSFVAGCKKDKGETEDVLPVSTEQNLKFHIHTQVGNQLANYTSTFQQASGRKFILADFRYYLSNIKLIKADGSEYPLSRKVILGKTGQEDYELGLVPVGNYNGLKFILGLDSITNHRDPTAYAAGNPLAIQSPGIHWSWSSGYIFFKVEGVCDTTAAANGSPNYPFFFHMGMDGLNRNIDFSNEAFNVISGTDKELTFVFDLLKVLQNIDLKTENETHTMNNIPLAAKIANNFSLGMEME